MRISAMVRNARARHSVQVCTGDATQSLGVAAKGDGNGSAVNGGEFLMLALATCYCNDLYREAARMGIDIEGVEVEASAEFAGVALAARDVRYRAKIASPADADAIARLMRQTDAVAEVHNTVRAGAAVTRIEWDAERA